jgi:hypothetical protein
MRNYDYPIGKYLVYDHSINHLRLTSKILAGVNGYSGDISSLSGCKALLAEYIGNLTDMPGYYHQSDGNKNKLALLPYIEQELAQVIQHWADFRQRRINEGGKFLPDNIDSMPIDLQSQRLKLESRLAIIHEEIQALKKRIAGFEKQKEEERNALILKYGPRGSSVGFVNGVPKNIDGQDVSVINGFATITSESSPYHLMKVSDYREFVIPAFRAMLKKREQEQLENLQEDARRNGWQVPMSAPSSVGKAVSRSSLPAWPDHIKPNAPAEVDAPATKPEKLRRTVKLI